MLKISVGISTYNPDERLLRLIKSIEEYAPGIDIVVIDDGSPDGGESAVNICNRGTAKLVKHDKNRGIPSAWNTAVKNLDADLIIMLNDDIKIISEGWVESIKYFFENNENIGGVGWPLIHIDPATGSPRSTEGFPTFDADPGLVGSAVGCSFGFLKKCWELIKNEDGSTGFWENLVSFYEEIFFGLKLAEKGYFSFMLPAPPLEHWGSRTFALNPELSLREVNENSYVTPTEYQRILEDNAGTLWIPITDHLKLLAEGKAYRMDYSRSMFMRAWGLGSETWQNPQLVVHNSIFKGTRKIPLKWLDENGNKIEKEIIHNGV